MVRFIEENGLESEGIFRLSGSSDRVKRLRQDLESNFYSNPKYSLYEVPDLTVHDVASTFKAFLRELPASLVSSERMEIFPDISGLPLKEQIKLTNMFILSMKEEYRDTLQVFLRLVASIIERKSVTKMEDSNLATCLTPNIFAMPKFSQPSAEHELKKLQEQFGYFRILATYHKKLLVVPPEFLSQIRQQYATGASVKPKRKFLSKFLGKKKGPVDLPPPREELIRISEVEIEIHAPHLQKESGVVKINASTTAKDVLEAYGLQPKDVIDELRRKLDAIGVLDEDRAVEYLYEVGGNIGERCLDPNTKVLDLYKVNPTAEWMIKCKKGR
ncbi:Rho GTPase-activating protein 18 [Bulinus truncatus]|nr:Rho GTPase-activating protein 18 [Bulinus truncatus]